MRSCGASSRQRPFRLHPTAKWPGKRTLCISFSACLASASVCFRLVWSCRRVGSWKSKGAAPRQHPIPSPSNPAPIANTKLTIEVDATSLGLTPYRQPEALVERACTCRCPASAPPLTPPPNLSRNAPSESPPTLPPPPPSPFAACGSSALPVAESKKPDGRSQPPHIRWIQGREGRLLSRWKQPETLL